MSEVLQRRFNEIGAQLQVPAAPWRGAPRLDVHGSTFDVRFGGGQEQVELEVVDVQPRDRHLLLLTRVDGRKSKFLCGRDERHWFVAAIPEVMRGVTGVATAKAALQPKAVREAVESQRPKDPFRRRNSAYVRQGEWFFVPAPRIDPSELLVLRDEPLLRSGGTPHVLQFAYRRGGHVSYVNTRDGSSIGAGRYARLMRVERRNAGWVPMVRDPDLYARGEVRHPHHATIHLAGWHRVLMNTENHARAMQHVVFLD